MSGGSDFEVRRLEAWMRERIDGFRAPLTLHRFKGGQSNPTYLVTDGGGRRYVLRKKPAGELLPSAHAVDREYRVIDALRNTDVPVAGARGYCDDATVIGTPFYVMDFVEGRILWDPALPGMDNAERTAIYSDMNRVVGALHRVDYRAVGLSDYGRPGNFFDRQIGRWTRQYQAAAIDDPIPAMDRLIEWLPAHIPLDTLADGAVRDETELSTLGHPLADFAYHVLPWRLTAAEFRGMAGVDHAALGIPDEAAYLRAYCQRVGRAPIDPAHWEFYVTYSMFRLAAILHGISQRARDGTASSAEAVETGARARPIAEAAWRQVQAHFSRGDL